MKSRTRPFAALAVALTTLVSPFAIAQKQAPQEPKLVESIDVRVINVDVVVTDRKGNPVTGLTKDDFEILENGVPKPISNFYEVEGSKPKNVVADATAAPAPNALPEPQRIGDVPESQKRRIIFYVDNLSMAPFNRNRVFNQMKEFVKTVMRPGDEAMVATFNRSLKVRVPFTRDPVQIQQMFDAIAGETAMGMSNKSEQTQMQDRIRDAQTYEEAVSIARNYASSVEHDLRQSASSLTGLMSTLAGVEGKKILVLTSEGFPMQPGREAFYFIDAMSAEKNWGGVAGASMLEGMTFDSSRLIQDIAKSANANGITMYAIHAAGLTGGSEMSAENRTATPFTVTQAAVSNTQESMQLMADMTGGIASTSTNNFDAAFKKILRDLDSYYSLGYRAGTERVDRQRYLSVRVKGKNYIVRNRQTFVEKSTYAEMSDRVVANLLYRVKANDLGIIARVGTPRPAEDGNFVVPLDVQIPIEKLTLLPQGDTESVGGFEVYVAVADRDGDMSDVSRKSHQVRIPTADLPKMAGKYYTYTLDLLMARGLNKISVGVVDSISNQDGFAREQIIAQDLR
ncbi:MAG TPA: VWA domain-containing protein [Thermoanaerobaculia bacterium]|nr:VWA domain-containing protein [Thermoanaerobaculia bacterium]